MTGEQYYQNASDVRKNWSMTIDSVVHERPALIRRTHNNIMMLDFGLISGLLSTFKFHVTMEREDDNSITGYVKELELVENAVSKELLLEKLIEAMKDYALDFYSEFSYWSKSPNRMSHIPYVIKLLTSEDSMILEDIICQNGRN